MTVKPQQLGDFLRAGAEFQERVLQAQRVVLESLRNRQLQPLHLCDGPGSQEWNLAVSQGLEFLSLDEESRLAGIEYVRKYWRDTHVPLPSWAASEVEKEFT